MARRSETGDRLRVAVLMGGPSSEHDVSLMGGRNVVAALDAARFAVRAGVIARDGSWYLSPRGARGRSGDGSDGFDPYCLDGWRRFEGPLPALCHLLEWPVDVALPILHGRFGEDGTLQACLAAAGIPFVGSGSAASALALDKVRTKEVLAYHEIRTPPFEVVEASLGGRGLAEAAERLVATHGRPLVLKAPQGGSSLEVKIADDPLEVTAALQELAAVAKRVLVERYVTGRELTAAVIQDFERREPIALPVVEIRPRRGRSFDYREKYSADGAEELCPAPIPDAVEAEARDLGLRVHRLLGLAGISRTDLILDEEGHLHVLEVNTLPGMTEQSLVPKAARAVGISFAALVENLIRTAGDG